MAIKSNSVVASEWHIQKELKFESVAVGNHQFDCAKSLNRTRK